MKHPVVYNLSVSIQMENIVLRHDSHMREMQTENGDQRLFTAALCADII